MKYQMKSGKLGVWAAAVMLAVSACSGGNGGSSGGSGPVAIQYYGGWTGADLQKMQGLVNKYNSTQSKVKVDLTSLQWSNMFTKFLADYQSGNSPDVVAMHTFEVGQFAKLKVLDPDMVKSMGLKSSDYLPIAWDGSHIGDVQYGVPLDVNMHGIYYNKDMFAAAGINSFPTTKDEFIAAAQKLTVDAKGNHQGSPGFDAKNIKTYGLGFAMNHHAFYQAYALLNQEGYNPFTADMTSISLDATKFQGPVNYLEDLIFKYKVVPVGEKSAIDDFKAGKVAMAVDGNFQLSGLGGVPFKWDTAEYPRIFSQKAVWGASELLTFPRTNDTKKQAASKEFVSWLAGNSAAWAASGQIPANKKAFDSMTKIKGIDAYIKELDYVKFLPAHPKATNIFSSTAPSPILTFAQDIVLNDKPYADVTARFEADINAAIK